MKDFDDFMKVDKEEINVHFIFNYIQNYMVSGAVVWAGIYVASRRGELGLAPCLDVAMGLVLVLTGVFAYSLNALHGMRAVAALSSGRLRYFFFSFLLTFEAVYFLGSSVGQSIR